MLAKYNYDHVKSAETNLKGLLMSSITFSDKSNEVSVKESDRRLLFALSADTYASHAGCTGSGSFDVPKLREVNSCLKGVRCNDSIQVGGLVSGEHLSTNNGLLGKSVENVLALPRMSELGNFKLEDGSVKADLEAVNVNYQKFEGALSGRLFGKRMLFFYLCNEFKRSWERFGPFRLVTIS